MAKLELDSHQPNLPYSGQFQLLYPVHMKKRPVMFSHIRGAQFLVRTDDATRPDTTRVHRGFLSMEDSQNRSITQGGYYFPSPQYLVPLPVPYGPSPDHFFAQPTPNNSQDPVLNVSKTNGLVKARKRVASETQSPPPKCGRGRPRGSKNRSKNGTATSRPKATLKTPAKAAATAQTVTENKENEHPERLEDPPVVHEILDSDDKSDG
ncbi:hypothetical protein B0H14DRAFT_2563202, partial [Mycena olivaceomarginata]